MSIYGAMMIGVSGLDANSKALSISSSNIANINTVGYKAAADSFSTLLASAVGSGDVSSAGVTANQAQLVTEQGGITATQSPTDLALSGNGFFVVSASAAATSGTSQSLLYTRAGNFTPDANGNLQNAAGLYLQGWPLSSDDRDAQMMFFLHHGYRVIAHDRRGHGRSAQVSEGNDMDHHADDLAGLVQHLDLHDAVHIGHSAGGGEVARYLGLGYPGGPLVEKEALTGDPAIAAAGFLTARCAGKDKYFQVVDAIYHGQDEMQRTGQPRQVLLNIARSAGLTDAQFDACIKDEKSLAALQARWDHYVKDDKITGTPTFVINGKVYDKGEMSMGDLDAAVAEAQATPKGAS